MTPNRTVVFSAPSAETTGETEARRKTAATTTDTIARAGNERFFRKRFVMVLVLSVYTREGAGEIRLLRGRPARQVWYFPTEDGTSGKEGNERFRRFDKKKILLFLAVLGPGIITASVDNDAGGIATYSIAAEDSLSSWIKIRGTGHHPLYAFKTYDIPSDISRERQRTAFIPDFPKTSPRAFFQL
jgi:hypothetical protein